MYMTYIFTARRNVIFLNKIILLLQVTSNVNETWQKPGEFEEDPDTVTLLSILLVGMLSKIKNKN